MSLLDALALAVAMGSIGLFAKVAYGLHKMEKETLALLEKLESNL